MNILCWGGPAAQESSSCPHFRPIIRRGKCGPPSKGLAVAVPSDLGRGGQARWSWRGGLCRGSWGTHQACSLGRAQIGPCTSPGGAFAVSRNERTRWILLKPGASPSWAQGLPPSSGSDMGAAAPKPRETRLRTRGAGVGVRTVEERPCCPGQGRSLEPDHTLS